MKTSIIQEINRQTKLNTKINCPHQLFELVCLLWCGQNHVSKSQMLVLECFPSAIIIILLTFLFLLFVISRAHVLLLQLILTYVLFHFILLYLTLLCYCFPLLHFNWLCFVLVIYWKHSLCFTTLSFLSIFHFNIWQHISCWGSELG